jgi:hypothetical protein
MSDLAPTGADAPGDDLRSEIETAFKATSEAEALQTSEPAAALPKEASAPDIAALPATGERPRDEQGRFTKAEQAAQAQKADAAVAAAQQAVQPGQQQPVAQAAVRPAGPPPGWSPTSKTLFDALPDTVKKDIAKREDEISQGFAKLAEYKGLDPYVDMARGNNTTLPEALDRYVAAENLLESQPVNGLLWLCQKYNVHPGQLLEAIGEPGHQQPQEASPLAPVMPYIQTLDQRLSQFEAQQAAAQDHAIKGEISSFSADPQHKYFENVRKEMGQIIALADQQGQQVSLKDAYEKACWANPEIRSLLIKDQIAANEAEAKRKADDARRAAGSLPTGSPIPGGTLARNEPMTNLRAEIERAFADSRV